MIALCEANGLGCADHRSGHAVGRNGLAHLFGIADSPGQVLSDRGGRGNLGHIRPVPVPGRSVNLAPVRNPVLAQANVPW